MKSQLGGFPFFVFFRALFIIRAFLPLAYKNKTLPLVGWSKKYLSVNYCDFLMPTDSGQENIWPLRNITNPWRQRVLKPLKTFMLLLSDGVSLGNVNDTDWQESTSGEDSHHAISVMPVLGHRLYTCEYRLGALAWQGFVDILSL